VVEINKKRIAKNTVFLYLRMLFIMGVSLYTSRVVLEVLGVIDFGIYQSVGGVVGMMTFVNSALSSGTSRFITYELGTNNKQRLKETFSTTLTIQIILILLIILLAETVGTWFVSNKLQIPCGNKNSALWAYHLSIFTTAISLFTVPYLAIIIAYERMKVFAYIGIYEVCAKLSIVYLLSVGSQNRLIMYAILLLVVQVTVAGLYILYCRKEFEECKFKFFIKKNVFKQVVVFSGWNLFAASSIALNSQGILVLLNMFFSPAVVAARAISLQVNSAANQFVSNFRTAVNPQIVKQYASGNFKQSKKLLLVSTKYSYYLMFLLSLPIYIGAQSLLAVWLKNVPEYTVVFLQLVVIQSLFQVFDTSFYTALYAKGDIKINALVSPMLGFLMFPIVYLLFKHGAGPIALSWASLVMYAVLGIIVKPILIVRIADYNWNEIWNVLRPCIVVSLIAGLLSYKICHKIVIEGHFINLCVTTLICISISCVTIYFLGLDNDMRIKLNNLISVYLNKYKR